MLGSALPASATATLHTSTSSATPTSPTRPSRLRGLSYLRNYTQNRVYSGAPGQSERLTRTISSPETTSQLASSPRFSEAVLEHTTAVQSGDGWLPTIQGRSGRLRDVSPLHPTSSNEAASPEINTTTNTSAVAGMTRSRAASAQLASVRPTPTPVDVSRSRTAEAQARRGSTNSMNTGDGHGSTIMEPPSSNTVSSISKEALPTIRFIPHVEARSTRPSLHFTAVSRTLAQSNSIVRVGRYSERDTTNLNTATTSSNTPVGFKSKVVSRRHCEFWCTNGQWYIKDVKSSSGTFLNHVRLSSPGVESRPYPVNDGDVVQLGIDFKGGEEVIFRCVKIRVECNRGWQKSLNSFNTTAHRRLLKQNAAGRDSDAASTSDSSECSICLNAVAPRQALFVAPCSHVWHYKCVRNLIQGPHYPNFLCPNCRFNADLEADVEQIEEEHFDDGMQDETGEGSRSDEEEDDEPLSHSTYRPDENTKPGAMRTRIPDEELAGMRLSDSSLQTHTPYMPTFPQQAEQNALSASASSRPMAIASPPTRAPDHRLSPRSATPTSTTQFALAAIGRNADMHMRVDSNDEPDLGRGPMTPRNDAGPFVLDGGHEGSGRASIASQALREVEGSEEGDFDRRW